jgi:hypothetical protein
MIGLTILFLREFQLFATIAKNIFSSRESLRVSQAWLAVFIAQINYGTLMNPLYLIMVMAVFSVVRRASPEAVTGAAGAHKS